MNCTDCGEPVTEGVTTRDAAGQRHVFHTTCAREFFRIERLPSSFFVARKLRDDGTA